MGCQISKEEEKDEKRQEQSNDTEVEQNKTKAMASKSVAATDFKSRLEWKLCLVCWKYFKKLYNFYENVIFKCVFFLLLHFVKAKDTPEPEFDLSDCNLKDIPSGVFVLCRVLLKERLKLQQNQLQSLSGGGSLNDLRNLQELNLNNNRFTQLPQNFCNILHNLRVNIKCESHLRRSSRRLTGTFIFDYFRNFLCRIIISKLYRNL